MSNIITDTIKFLFELRRETVVEINGRNYLNTDNGIKEIDEPGFPALQGINSLDGLVAYLKSDVDKIDQPDMISRNCFILVEKYWTVNVVTAPYGDFLKRDLITDCNHTSLYSLDGRENGKLTMHTEMAQQILQSWFAPTHDQEYVLSLISNLVIDDDTHIVDDGISQRVSLRTGVTTVGQTDVKRIVSLQPYITFPEIEQPVIPYVVRLSENKGTKDVTLYLTPVEDPGWRMKTKLLIKQYLAKELGPEWPIFY